MSHPRSYKINVRHFAINVLLTAASVLFVLAMGEVAVRVIEPRSDHKPLCRDVPDSGRLWEHLPNREVVRKGVTVRTNSHGQRDREFQLEKPPSTYRILSLGDSFTFGTGLNIEDTYPKQLERMLNADSSRGELNYEVINCGVEGYNTAQELAYLKEKGLDFKPDLVLLQYLYNDAVTEASPAPGRGHTPENEPGTGMTRAIRFLKSKSHFFAFLSPRVGALLRKLGVKKTGSVGAYVQAYRDGNQGWERSKRAILEMKALLDARGIRLVVVIFPALVSLDREDYPLLFCHRAVREFCERNSIMVLDLFPSVEGMKANKLWVYLTDAHPNASANHIFTEEIYDFLRRRNIL